MQMEGDAAAFCYVNVAAAVWDSMVPRGVRSQGSVGSNNDTLALMDWRENQHGVLQGYGVP